MWWVLVPPAVLLGKFIYDVVTSEEIENRKDPTSGNPKKSVRTQKNKRNKARRSVKSKEKARTHIVFEERGDLEGRKVVVIGRTGAGKSSLINMLHGTTVLTVAPVASTTRWIEGVRFELGHSSAVLVDTPGYGEFMTAEDYASGLTHWVRKHKSEIGVVLMVIQADSKAHAEDKRILAGIVKEIPNASALVVLSQVDKLLPVRQPLDGPDWKPKKRNTTLKEKHITEKIKVVCEQFGIMSSCIVPAAADEYAFNRKQLLKCITVALKGSSTRA